MRLGSCHTGKPLPRGRLGSSCEHQRQEPGAAQWHEIKDFCCAEFFGTCCDGLSAVPSTLLTPTNTITSHPTVGKAYGNLLLIVTSGRKLVSQRWKLEEVWAQLRILNCNADVLTFSLLILTLQQRCNKLSSPSELATATLLSQSSKYGDRLR